MGYMEKSYVLPLLEKTKILIQEIRAYSIEQYSGVDQVSSVIEQPTI